VNAFLIAFFDFQFAVGSFEQIVDAVEVELNEADPDCELSFV
jgi:hypothetical protein